MFPAEGFGVELGALVLFKADSAVGARLGTDPHINKDAAQRVGSMSNSLQILQP